jgi:plastocyanin
MLMLPLVMLVSSVPLQASAQQDGGDHKPTYWIYVNPGMSAEPLQHYSPNYIAVPAGMTVEWINNDVGVQHTVTSGNPGDLDTGSKFNSGPMFFGANYQLTFGNESGLVGDLPYYCVVHPWATGLISVNNEVVQGDSFELASGTGTTIDLSKDNRTIFVFRPINLPTQDTGEFPENPLFYEVALIRNSDNETVFTDTFQPQGKNLQIEAVQSDTATSTPVVTSDSGGVHVAGSNILSPGSYTLAVEITHIGASPPPEPMKDEFELQVTSGSTEE